MRRPVTRNLLVFSFGLSLLAASGCSTLRAGLDDAFAADASRPSPDIAEMTSPEAAFQDAPFQAASFPAAPAKELLATQPPDSEALASQRPSQVPLAEETLTNRVPPADPAATRTADGGPKTASCFIEIREAGKPPKRIRMSLNDATHVQKVLEQTGLVKEFKTMQIELSRKVPDGTRHKLEVRYDTQRNEVESAFDYALHPNDLLVVTEGTAPSLGEMMKKMAGPLAR